jgi:hypothetical protein
MYTDNAPVNAELDNTGFETHRALLFSMGLEFKPGMSFGRRNDFYYELPNKAPVINLNYKAGLGQVVGDANFHHVNLSVKDEVEFSRSKLKLAADAGLFLGEKPEYFMDYQHFMGNQTPFLPSKGLTSYRLLNYYNYSTAEEHFSAFAEYRPTKLFLSQFKGLRKKGFEEYLFVNYLAAPTSNKYVELGMGFDNIFRFVKLETIASFQDGSFQEFGIRIGIASFLNISDDQVSIRF